MTDTNQNTGIIDPIVLQAVQTAMQNAVSQVRDEHTQIQREIVLEQIERQQEMELNRRNHELQLEMRRVKVEMIKIATDTLASNAKAKPVDERDVTVADIKTFADELIQYINDE